jgi:hypothetical protein
VHLVLVRLASSSLSLSSSFSLWYRRTRLAPRFGMTFRAGTSIQIPIKQVQTLAAHIS